MLATYPQYSPHALMSPFGAPLFAPPPGYPYQAFPQSYIPSQAQYAVAQQLVLALGQLAQQISVHSVMSQQIGSALQQLSQQLQLQTLPGALAFGAGQPYAPIAAPFSGVTSPFIGTPGQPAWQAWGGPRPQTIQ